MFKRLKQIVSANTNAILDKYEDPEKMVDQYIRETEATLGEVKGKTADAMAIAEKCEKKVIECKENIAAMDAYAEQAYAVGNEEDLEKFIDKKLSLEEQLEGHLLAADTANANAAKMREMHDQLSEQLISYKNKRDVIRSKMAIIKTSEKVSEIASLTGKIDGTAGNFARMEEKLEGMLSKQAAIAELDNSVDSLDEVKAKYDISQHSKKLAEAVEAFKASKQKPAKVS